MKIMSVIIGMLITLMITLNGVLSNGVGNYTSSVMIHLIGLIGIILVLIVTKSKIILKKELPFYLYSAGFIGAITVLFNNISIGNIGVSLTVSLGLLGQTIFALISDHYGLFKTKKITFKRQKIIGLLIIVLGIFSMTLF